MADWLQEVAKARLAAEKGTTPSFDPEGDDYDLERAISAGMKPEESGPNAGHMGSVAEVTDEERREFNLPDVEAYMLLKGRKHETWDLAVEAERQRGFKVIKRGNRYFSVPADVE